MSYLVFVCFSVALVFAIKNEDNVRYDDVFYDTFSFQSAPRSDDPGVIKKNDMETYIKSLEDLVSFYVKYSNEVDVNTVFGFFVLKVNIASAINNKPKGVPNQIIGRLNAIKQKSKKIIDYYHMMASQPQFQTPFFKNMKKKASLYSDVDLWLSQMNAVNKLNIPSNVTSEDLISRFSSFSDYISLISKAKKMMLSYTATDNCLKKLADNTIYFGQSAFPRCKLTPECVNGVTKGSDNGYGLVNRLTVLLLARLGRRCSIVSQAEDRKIVNKLCSSSYYEAWFISLYDFNPIMLFMEQITHCSLNGNVEFLRKDWFTYILALQTSYGCFSDQIVTEDHSAVLDLKPSSKWELDKGNMYRQPGTQCYGPASSTAAVMLSAAVKYTLKYIYDPKKQ